MVAYVVREEDTTKSGRRGGGILLNRRYYRRTVQTYQVTRKRQVTIPKSLAERLDIKPGDSVVFEDTTGGVVLRKVERAFDQRRLEEVAEALAKDMRKVGPYVRVAERAAIESLSRRVRAQ